MTRNLAYACAGLSLSLLMLGYFLAGYLLPGMLLILLELLWTVGFARRWSWTPVLGLYAAFGCAALGFLLGLTPGLLVAGGLLALPAWDLAEFAARLRLASPEDNVAGMERWHLLRLGIVMLIGGGLSALALLVRFKIPFEWTVVLVFLAIWGIGRMVKWLLKQQS